MKIGFCGPSRSGKTTLARVVADRLRWEFRESPVTQYVDSMGMNWGKDQEHIQEDLFTLMYDRECGAPDNCVFDRTVADVLAYHQFIPDFTTRMKLYQQAMRTTTPLDLVFVCEAIGTAKIAGMFVPIDTFVLAAYAYYGPVVVIVPADTVDARLAWVLKRMTFSFVHGEGL